MTIELRVALSTCPDDAVAQQIARTVVTEGLAACVNRLPAIQSTYLWKGQLQEDTEILLIIKTTAGRVDALERRLRELHPYQVPEFVVFEVTAASKAYLDWVSGSCA